MGCELELKHGHMLDHLQQDEDTDREVEDDVDDGHQHDRCGGVALLALGGLVPLEWSLFAELVDGYHAGDDDGEERGEEGQLDDADVDYEEEGTVDVYVHREGPPETQNR